MIFHSMRDATRNLLESIHQLPFNVELSNGTLPKDKFIFYLAQDAFYLADYAKALALIAAKLNDTQHSKQFMQFALGAIAAEQDLHTSYLEASATTQLPTEPSPGCFIYTNFLLKMASLASVEEGVAALLPCLWVYREVGRNIFNNQKKPNPYQRWIDLYASDEFDVSVAAAIQIINELASNASELLKEKMRLAFIRSTQLEWLFWDSAYRQEQWPIQGEKHHAIWSIT